jgi:DNA-directed RNA polymerase specialized sigma24 family protein
MDESAIQTLHAEGRYDEATTALLSLYGREIFGFLRARLRTDDRAKEAYSLFAMDLWRGQCSFRAWAYTIARNAGHRHAESAARPRRHEVALGEEPAPAIAALVRTATAEYLRTEVKSRFAELRDQLSEEEQTILVLRVDKRMEWRDVAAVMIGTEAAQDDLDREAGRLRQSFHQLKKRLKTLARAQGLIRDDDS